MLKMRFKHQVHSFTELEDNEAIKREFRGYPDGLMRSNPGGWILQPNTVASLDAFRTMNVRDTDIWIVTYPKVVPVLATMFDPPPLSAGPR